VPVYKFNGDISKIDQSEPHNDEAVPVSAKPKDESTLQKSEAINADSISPSYEVIDGTTVYLEGKLSVQPSLVSEAQYVTAFPDKQAPNFDSDSKTDPNHGGLSLNRNIINNDEKLQSSTNNIDNKLEGIKPLIDTPEINTEILIESSEVIINSTLDTATSKSNTAALESSKSENEPSKDPAEDLELKKESTDSNAGIDIENKEQEMKQEFKNEGILASLTNTFNILTGSKETATEKTENAENNAVQNSDDISASTTVTASSVQLSEQISENIEVKDSVTKETILTTLNLDSSIDPSSTSTEKPETQQEIIHKDMEALDKEVKIKKEESLILLENVTSLNDVPSSNNFVHEDTDKAAKELPMIASALLNADINSHVENTIPPETNIKIAENIGTENVIATTESIVSSESQDSALTGDITITQSSDHAEQILVPENDENLENKLKDVNKKETITRMDKSAAIEEMLETDSSQFVEEITNIVTESLHKDHIAGEKTVIVDETLNHNAADIPLIGKSIVYSNVNKKDNFINDATSGSVPVEFNQLSNNIDSKIFDAEQSVIDSSQKVISEQITFNEILQDQELSSTANLEHKNGKLIAINNIKRVFITSLFYNICTVLMSVNLNALCS
jgi:hypothetical protein